MESTRVGGAHGPVDAAPIPSHDNQAPAPPAPAQPAAAHPAPGSQAPAPPAPADQGPTDQAATDAPSRIDAEVALLSQQLGRHARLLHLLKTQLPDVTPTGVDWATFGVLAQLVKCGATRQAELAGMSMLDPSTVSRYVGQLVRQGLAERRPDPQDGRAVRLVPTPHGQALVEDIVRRRNQAFMSALAGWQEADLRALTTLLTRFNDDLEAFRQHAGRASPPSGHFPTHRADPSSSSG